MSGIPGAMPGLATDRQTLETIYQDILSVLTDGLPSAPADLTDAVLESVTNDGAARIMDALPVDPEEGVPMPEQYQHRGVVITFPSEDNAGDTRGRETEGMLLTVVLHGMYRTDPLAQRASAYGFWRWEEAIRRRIRRTPLLHNYRPRYIGTKRGQSRTGAEWQTFALTFTFYRNTWGA